jgi:signal peptidase
MEPAIHTGAIVAVKPMPDYKVGDIITFGPNTKTKVPTTHRITEIKNNNGVFTYTTKGDANNAPDTTEIRQSEIIGKVLFSVPYAGYAVDAAKKPWGFAAIIIIPALLIIFDESKKIKDEIVKMKNNKNSKPIAKSE